MKPGKKSGGPRGAVYERVFALCPALAFAPPWSFLEPGEDCRACVPDPAAALVALRKEFADAELERAGVVELTPPGEWRLPPALCNPAGAVIAHRAHGRHADAFLTARGFVGDERVPVLAAIQDAWTQERVLQTRVLFAAPHAREVALLRALDLPATLCLEFGRLSARGLGLLDAAFQGWEYSPAPGPGSEPFPSDRWPPEEDSTPMAYRPMHAIRPTLVLLGWSPLSLAPGSPLGHRAAALLSTARRHLGLQFSGVSVWRPSPEELANLRFRLSLPLANKKLIRELLLETLDRLHDIEFASPEALSPEEQPATLADARDELLRRLAAERGCGPLSQRVRAALQQYSELLDRDLVKPLRDWARGNDHPVAQNVGDQLASLSGMLHELSPTVHELLRRQSELVLGGSDEPRLSEIVSQYLQLMNRHGALLRDLRRWDKWI